MNIKILILIGITLAGIWLLAEAVNKPDNNLTIISNSSEEVVKQEPAVPQLKIPEEQPKQISSIKSNWEIKPIDPAFEKQIRNEYGIVNGDVKQLVIPTDMVSQFKKGDILQLSTPNTDNIIEVQISDASKIGDVPSIAGNITGSGIGYGVALSQSGDVIAGSIVTEQGSWSVDTVRGVTFITNGLNTISHDDIVR